MQQAFHKAEDADRFFAAAGEASAFGSVQTLYQRDYLNPASTAFPLALSQGAFAGLQQLVFTQKMGEAPFHAFCQALEVSPCAKTLTVLGLSLDAVPVAGVQAFAATIGKGGLPSLQSLSLRDNRAGEGTIHLFEGLKAADHPLSSFKKAYFGVDGTGR